VFKIAPQKKIEQILRFKKKIPATKILPPSCNTSFRAFAVTPTYVANAAQYIDVNKVLASVKLPTTILNESAQPV
jgi:hypothetical protein